MSNHYGRYYTDISHLPASAPTGWYAFYNKTHRQYVPVYVDQDYDGGGWVCVLANRRYTAGMHNLTYDNAVNTPNYRTEPSSDDATNTTVAAPDTYNKDLTDYNIFIGLKFWDMFGGRHASGKISIAQYITNTGNGIELNDTGNHTFRSRWYFTNFDSGDYWKSTGTGWTGNEVGSTSPGMYSYHFANAYKLTTYDADHDVYAPANCATLYNNNPFWYGACWSGNQFAGGGHVDGPYWSGSGTSYQYGAVYIK
tara:strand:- start:465 stop:1223 length:759 start_codon:yes stop_codon:yes gene_type:complete